MKGAGTALCVADLDLNRFLKRTCKQIEKLKVPAPVFVEMLFNTLGSNPILDYVI